MKRGVTRLAFLLILGGLAASAHARQAAATVVSVNAPQADSTTTTVLTWEYTFKFTETPANTEVSLFLSLPPGAEMFVSLSNGQTKNGMAVVGNERQLRLVSTSADPTFVVQVQGTSDRVKRGNMAWRYTVGTVSETGAPQPGPETLYDASRFRLIFAAGTSFRQDDVADFRTESDALLIENDSRLRPSGIIGAAFKITDTQSVFGIGHFRERKPVDFLLSLEFADDTSRALDGLMFGLGVGIQPYLEFFGGVSVRRGEELSVGFKAAAQDFVARMQADPNQTGFDRFGSLDNDELFDGLPLIDPTTSEPFFVGEPITSSTNTAWIFGVALPLDLGKLIGVRQ